MHTPLPLTRDLVLLGGGHAHALVLRRWGMRPLPGVRLTVINPAPTAPYTGMLPGLVAGHYAREELDIDLVRLARFAGARLVTDRATGLDRDAGRVLLAGRPPVPWDVLSIDVGVGAAIPDLPGMAEHALAVKPMDVFADRWQAFLAEVATGRAEPSAAVIGAGVAGVEIALAIRHRLGRLSPAPRVTLVEAGQALSAAPPALRRRLRRRLAEADVALVEGAAVARVTAAGAVLADGREVPAARVISAAGPRPQPWLAQTGLPTTDGYLRVDRTLRSPADGRIFAAGDCAHLDGQPRPKAGVYAVRAAPVLHANLRAALSGGALRRFRAQRDFLKLISLGRQEALAERGGLVVQGAWLWRLKHRIDRRFMDSLSDLRPMRPAPPRGPVAAGVRAALAGGQPPCAGCGAKVAAGALAATLAGLPPVRRGDVEVTAGDDAAVLRLGGARQVLTTDHLRAFTEDPWTLGRIAAVHALGDVWAMGAAPQAALAQIILPRMAERMQAETLREVMAGAAMVFEAAGAAIVGGHTTEGAEMTVGFTVTGLAPAAPIGHAGARPGDALLLTAPLGSGTILAAEMALKARGAEVAAALADMARPQGEAAEILAGAHAMTDVTGFGLAGHLAQILRASGVGATLWLDALPLMQGAERLAGLGIRSTLWAANRAGAGPVAAPQGARAALLFDPQTGGGLLAAVPATEAAACLARLRAAGCPAAHVGEVTEGPPAITAR